MKIGIVTIIDDTNFGNRLQNYALYYVLHRRFGCKVVTLASHKEKAFCDGNIIAWSKETIAKYIGIYLPQISDKFFGATNFRWINFSQWNKNIPTKHYYGNENLPKRLSKKYDYFFAGSDQIWNYHFSFGKFYNFFLKFAKDSQKVAISASFGVDEIPQSWIKEYRNGLRGFRYISVREDVGQTIIKNLLERSVPVLIDPTMMLSKEEWLKVARKPRIDCSKPYILKYYLGDKASEDKIDTWAKENGFQVYELLNREIPDLYSAGPGEFISLINNASLICSDSFHCIVFSIIFSKPFIVYERKGSENYMTSRLNTLLNKFKFQHRWIHKLHEDEYLDCDFSFAKDKMKREQEKFLDFILNVLND